MPSPEYYRRQAEILEKLASLASGRSARNLIAKAESYRANAERAEATNRRTPSEWNLEPRA